jgi:PPE-repeat protein
MTSVIFTTQPVDSTIFVGTDTTLSVTVSSNILNPTYTYQWSVSSTVLTTIPDATNSSLLIDPNFSDSGNIYTVSVSALSATSTGLSAVAFASSTGAKITVIDDPVPPFNVLDVYPESGRARHRRLRLLGYI